MYDSAYTMSDGKMNPVYGAQRPRNGAITWGVVGGILGTVALGAVTLGRGWLGRGHDGHGHDEHGRCRDERYIDTKIENALLKSELKTCEKYATKCDVGYAVATSSEIDTLKAKIALMEECAKHTLTETEIKDELRCFEKETRHQFHDVNEYFAKKPIGEYKRCPMPECGCTCEIV